jgi:hypothetical protein
VIVGSGCGEGPIDTDRRASGGISLSGRGDRRDCTLSAKWARALAALFEAELGQ